MNTKRMVKAGTDRTGNPIKVFFPLDIKAAPGRRTFVLEGETVIEVDESHRFVMRSIRCGDLVVVRTEKLAGGAPKRTRTPKPEMTDRE